MHSSDPKSQTVEQIPMYSIVYFHCKSWCPNRAPILFSPQALHSRHQELKCPLSMAHQRKTIEYFAEVAVSNYPREPYLPMYPLRHRPQISALMAKKDGRDAKVYPRARRTAD
jgi:hypothetical protein